MKDKMEFTIGSRIISDGNFATVRFVGEVPPTKGEWLGVEWDDPDRGKHDGVHEGTRYFTTKHPKSGSFIRPKKATPGVSLMRAVQERYGLIDDDNAGVDVQEMFVIGQNQRTTVEVVGAQSVNKQQSQLERLHEVVLRECCVRDAGAPGALKQLIPRVKELDLSKNLLMSWESVARIAEQLDKLWSLKVSENKLLFPDCPGSLVEGFLSITTLFINRMDYTWDEVLMCTEMMTSLNQIHLCFNKISTIPSLGSHLHNIRLINLESNPLEGWEQVLIFGQLNNLETLILNDTGVEIINIPDVEHGKKSAMFPNLQILSLSKNKISKWSYIDELNKLQSLTELNFMKNPVLAEYDDGITPRTIMIGKIANILMINRSKLKPMERKWGEIDYLKIYGEEWRQSGGHQDPAKNKPSAKFSMDHPRYQALIDKYGAPEDSELVQMTTALKNSLISVNIFSPMVPEKPPLKKKLPVTMTVQKLKMMVHRLYRQSSMNMSLSYTSAKVEGLNIQLETDQKDIGYYSIEDGDTILVKWS